MTSPRVAFFTDSFHEVNGVALTSRQFESFADRRQLPFFSVHAGPETTIQKRDSLTVFEIQRSNAAFNLEATSDLSFDPLIVLNRSRLLYELGGFKPYVVHITGPGDFGILAPGLPLGSESRLPHPGIRMCTSMPAGVWRSYSASFRRNMCKMYPQWLSVRHFAGAQGSTGWQSCCLPRIRNWWRCFIVRPANHVPDAAWRRFGTLFTR